MGNNELGSVKSQDTQNQVKSQDTQNLLLVGVIKGLAHMLTALIQVDHRVNLEVKKTNSGFKALDLNFTQGLNVESNSIQGLRFIIEFTLKACMWATPVPFS